MNNLNFVLPIEPTSKRTGLIGKRGKYSMMYKTAKQKDNEAFLNHYLDDYVPELPIEGPVIITVHCYFKIPKSISKKKTALMMAGEIRHTKKPDLDNLLKNLFDCMTVMGFWGDDRQVVELRCTKQYEDSKGPRWEVSMSYEDQEQFK